MSGAYKCVLGIIGGIGSGKSLVASMFEQMGAIIVSADQLGHEVLRLPEIKTQLRQHFGDAIFDENGEIVRQKLGKIVFEPNEHGSKAKEFLESLSHPKIGELIRHEFELCKKAGKNFIVLDAPLLLEGNWDKLCDAILFVEAPEPLRRERAMKRGWTCEEFTAREAAQIPLEIKRQVATWIIQNDGTKEECQERIREVLGVERGGKSPSTG